MAYTRNVLDFVSLMSQQTCAEVDEKTESRVKNEAVVNDITSREEYTYPGSGTYEDPYVVDWDITDKSYPYNWSSTKRWVITLQVCTPES